MVKVRGAEREMKPREPPRLAELGENRAKSDKIDYG
jgi:hypothetical protein